MQMPALKQSSSTVVKYSSNRGETQLREAIAFFFLVKGSHHGVRVPHVDEFFTFTTAVNAQLQAAAAAQRKRPQSPIHKLELIDLVFPKMNHLQQCLCIVRDALILFNWVKSYMEVLVERGAACSDMYKQVCAKLETIDFGIPLKWYFRNRLTLFEEKCKKISEILENEISGVYSALHIPEFPTSSLAVADMAATALTKHNAANVCGESVF